MRDLIRHGDLLLRPIDKVREGDVRPRSSKVILEGEITGHAHRLLEDGEATILDYYEKTWREEKPVRRDTYVQVASTVTLTHEEHGPLTIAPGLYEVIRAREFDYAANLARRVYD